jgi:hypothetical protein
LCPYIRGVLDALGTEVFLVRLLRLAPGELVKYHTDEVVFGDPRRIIRTHLPITTNPDAALRFGTPLQEPAPGYYVWRARQDVELNVPAGELWFTNVNALHSVFNGGTEARVHLVADIRPRPNLGEALARWQNETREN